MQFCDAKSLRDLLILENIGGKNDGNSFEDNSGIISSGGVFPGTNENTKSIEASQSDSSIDNEVGTNSKILNGIPYLNSSPQQLDPNGDFSYSQKLFHIADGNLYSIFSPLQGRSYGVKPSFLRKQKCTIQECHAKGKKHMRKGLKFHNFLPSESVTSEKDNNILDKWKVHSECRLREEHGTKQIVISNWSSNLESSCEFNDGDDEETETISKGQMCIDPENEVPLFTPGNVKTPSHSSPVFDSKAKFQPCFKGINSAFSSGYLSPNHAVKISQENSFLAERDISDNKFGNSMLNEMLYSVENSPLKSNHVDFADDTKKDHSESGKKHRRKPIQTRRVVPYVKYLSLMDEIESSPLDLSAKSSKTANDSSFAMEIEPSSSKVQLSKETLKYVSEDGDVALLDVHSSNKASQVSFTSELPPCKSLSKMDLKPVVNDIPLSYSVPVMQNQLYPMPNLNISKGSGALAVSKVPFTGGHFILNKQLPKPSNELIDVSNESLTRYAEMNRYQEEKLILKTAQPRTRRRRSQRSVIKQKLEDTFRQNGFLVKTKQVSDGEATFCKFRQLRKYTRYYLKSWQHHLPEEVHKMWKGFLPPKTVLPPILGPPANSH